MGCLLGCFGFSSKRKRRKLAYKLLPGHQRLGSYEPLDSSVPLNFDITEYPVSLDSELSNKPKERRSVKIRKKVSFNLNVQTYEPIQNTYYHILESDEEEKKEESSEETAKGNLSFPISEDKSTALRMGTYPSNYRYQNCMDRYDEEDEIANEESDLDYDDENDFENDVDEQRTGQEELSEQFCSLSLSSQQKLATFTQSANEKTNNLTQICDSTAGEVLKSIGLSRNTRDRSQYVSPVLNPVQNLAQWKAVKAKAAPVKNQRKENVAVEPEPLVPSSKTSLKLSPFDSSLNCNQSKPPLKEIAVDASLSNWLASSNESVATRISKCSSNAVENKSSKRNLLDRSSHSWRSREEIPILDITNLETR